MSTEMADVNVQRRKPRSRFVHQIEWQALEGGTCSCMRVACCLPSYAWNYVTRTSFQHAPNTHGGIGDIYLMTEGASSHLLPTPQTFPSKDRGTGAQSFSTSGSVVCGMHVLICSPTIPPDTPEDISSRQTLHFIHSCVPST